MLVIRIRDLLQPGPTSVSILLGCMLATACYIAMRSPNYYRKRVFILGPAHHVYMDGCALSQCTYYSTPLGNLPLDEDSTLSRLEFTAVSYRYMFLAISELRKTDMFKDMDYPTDCDEHSIEMHLPYVRKMFAK